MVCPPSACYCYYCDYNYYYYYLVVDFFLLTLLLVVGIDWSGTPSSSNSSFFICPAAATIRDVLV